MILAGDAPRRDFAHEPPAKVPGNGNHLLLVKARDGVPRALLHRRRLEQERPVRGSCGWESYVKSFAAAVASPLTVTVSARP